MDVLSFLHVLKWASPVIIPLIGLIKVPLSRMDFPLSRRRRVLRDYEFIDDFMSVPLEWRHPLIVENAFGIWLHKSLHYQEIMAILKFANPASAFRVYGKVAPFLELDDCGKFVHIKKYADKGRCRQRIAFWIVIYFILAILAMLPLWLLSLAVPLPSNLWPQTIVVCGACGYAAWLAVSWAAAIKSSERFLQEQERKQASPLSVRSDSGCRNEFIRYKEIKPIDHLEERLLRRRLRQKYGCEFILLLLVIISTMAIGNILALKLGVAICMALHLVCFRRLRKNLCAGVKCVHVTTVNKIRGLGVFDPEGASIGHRRFYLWVKDEDQESGQLRVCIVKRVYENIKNHTNDNITLTYLTKGRFVMSVKIDDFTWHAYDKFPWVQRYLEKGSPNNGRSVAFRHDESKGS